MDINGLHVLPWSRPRGLTEALWLMQYLAELMIQNYCMSDLGVTTYAQPQGEDSSYSEGKPDVSELFEQQQLVAASQPGLLPPVADMQVKVEVRLLRIHAHSCACCSAVEIPALCSSAPSTA